MHTHTITPNQTALPQIAKLIWEIALHSHARPLVILPTAGPNASLRQTLEKTRPQPNCAIPLFAEIHSRADWLDLAPNLFTFPEAQSATERILHTYTSLDKHPSLRAWFEAEGEGGAWSLAKAIVKACDLLTHSILPQLSWDPQNLALEREMLDAQQSLNRAIQAAYPKLAQELVTKEAAVLLAFWSYLSSVRDPIIHQYLRLASYVQQFATVAETRRPLIWIDTVEEQAAQLRTHTHFLESCAQHIPVHRLTMDWSTVALWSEALHDPDPASAAQQIKNNHRWVQNQHIQCISAKRFEDLAWEAAACIETHLYAGRKHIALIAQDRLLARRTRALLSRLGSGLCIQDETGWKLSTTRAAAALHAWLELLRCPKSGPTATGLLEFLKNPFFDLAHVFPEADQSSNQWIAELENILLMKHARASWVSFYLAIEASTSSVDDSRLHTLLHKVRERVELWQSKDFHNPLCANALTQLWDDLSIFGMQQQFEQDAAGLQLLAMLQMLGLQQAKLQALRMPLNEWITLLKTVMEEEVYREQGQQASATVSILPLSATRLRNFDAIVMVGCDERQLPSFAEPPLFFSEPLCQILGGSDLAWQYQQQARDLSQLLASYPCVDLLWQSEGASGEPLRASSWILRLQTALPGLKTQEARIHLRSSQAMPVSMASAKRLSGLPMPTRMSPSAYRALRSCPYQYYVRSLLGLRKRKGLDEALDASILGQTLHHILRNFFQELKTAQFRDAKQMSDLAFRKSWMCQHLDLASQQSFTKLLAGDRRILGPLRDWQKQIPSFVDWQLEREQAQWQFHDAEVKVGYDFAFTDMNQHEHRIRIEGYADRIDIKPMTNEMAVLDYKHQTREKMQERASQIMDDPQLLLYATALQSEERETEHAIGELGWVALKMNLKKKDPRNRSLAIEEVTERIAQLENQLHQDLSAVWSGQAMRAFAPESTCRYCEVRGICRKGMW